MRCPHLLKLVSQTSGQPIIGKWCAAVHGWSTLFYQRAALWSAESVWVLRSVRSCDISWREMTQHFISLSLWTCFRLSFSKLMWCLDFGRGMLSAVFLLQGKRWTFSSTVKSPQRVVSNEAVASAKDLFHVCYPSMVWKEGLHCSDHRTIVINIPNREILILDPVTRYVVLQWKALCSVVLFVEKTLGIYIWVEMIIYMLWSSSLIG